MNVLNLQEKKYSKLSEEQIFRKVAETLYIFITTRGRVANYVKMMQ